MKLIRTTYWTNGLITKREMEIKNETELKQLIDEQARRVLNGPGIDSVEVFDFRGRRYLCFDKPKPVLQGNNPVFMVQHAAAQMEANMFAAMMVNGTKEDLQRYCIENGMAVPSDNRIKLAKANARMVEALQDGECPSCHGAWGGPITTVCKGCGYELGED